MNGSASHQSLQASANAAICGIEKRIMNWQNIDWRKRWPALAIVVGALTLLVIMAITMSGCSGCGKPVKPDKPTAKPLDTLDEAKYRISKAEEAPKFREALDLVNKHLDRHPEEMAKFQLTDKERQYLEKFVGLGKGELDEISTPTFKLLDAHHLEGCHLLREAARSMPLQALSPLERAEFCF